MFRCFFAIPLKQKFKKIIPILMRRDISSHSRMWYTLHNITKIEKNRGWIIFCNRNQNIGYLSKDLDFYRTVSFLSDNTDFNELKLLRLSGEYVFKIRI